MARMHSLRNYLSINLILLVFINFSHSFNVGTQNYVLHRGEKDSMFGFSVAQHRDRGQSWLLVGAPQAWTSQPGVTRGGAVYRCEINRDDSCQEIPFDRTGNNNNNNGAQIDSKSGQWFGATVKSSGENGAVLACAPRYTYFSRNFQHRDPVGTCYVASNSFSAFDEYSPCRTDNWGYHRQGSCQAGLGADISKDGKRLFIGAPGSWYWQGQVYSINGSRPVYVPPAARSSLLNAAGQAFSQSIYNRPDSRATGEGTPLDDDSYLGYSVAAGDFTGEGRQGAAVGMPRGASLLGKVVLFTWDLVNVYNVTGAQLGAYFGYSVCSADVDGDGLHDLIVGAPLHTDLSNNEGKYETGRVYVFYQGTENKFRRMETRDGEKSKSRFGLSLTTLGDINKDRYEDFAVGAPYDGPQERGAVYIFHGSKLGVREKHSQVVYAEEVGPTLSTFGFSVAGGHDLDENEYPDLLVGAYESNTVVYFRSRPVVNMNAQLTFSSEVKQINLEETACRLRDNTPVSCSSLNACFEYSGVGVERRLDFEVQFVLDAKKPKSPRMFFLDKEGRSTMNQTLRLNKGSLVCRNVNVYIKRGIRDKLTPIEAELRYSMLTSPTSSIASVQRIKRSLEPVLDLNHPPVQRDVINIQKNCGSDNICIPDLNMTAAPSVSRYLLGSEKRLEFNVEVYNAGEDAFESMFYLTVPSGLNYINIERVDHDAEVAVQCSAPSYATNNTLRCDIGNPLPARSLVHFKVLLQPSLSESSNRSRYDFYMEVNSTNPEAAISVNNNKKKFSIPIWVETDLIVQGSSLPPELYYNTEAYKSENFTHESQIGPQVVHIYAIRNKGPSSIIEAEAYFLWPSYTLGKDHFLYLLEQPETSGPIRCEQAKNVNPLRVTLDRKKSYLGLESLTEEDFVRSGLGSVHVEDNELEAHGGGGLHRHHETSSSSVEEHRSSSSSTATSRGRSQYSTSSWSSSWSSEWSSDNGGGAGRRGGWTRTRRQIERDYDDDDFEDSEAELDAALRCGPTECTQIKCAIGPLAKDQEVWVAFRGRVFVDTIKKIGEDRVVKLSSQVASRMTRLPYIGQPEKMHVKAYEVITEVETDTPHYKPDYVPWWVVVLSACAGAAILILLIFLLWKCGFFKRNRPTGASTAEKEPLNRNGHYQAGDEAL